MKIIAFYLPQFHCFPENDAWWGTGFTEWNNVRSAQPLFKNHNQPRVPLDNNYYDLTETENLRWQAHLAQKYGVYGFGYYHYWFNGKLLIEKPMEQMLSDK
ncbi:MAG: glycoside hydrolase family 99-like domain-containing protein, partial [Blautia hansenii]